MYWNFILNDGATQLQLDTPPLGWDSGTANITRDGEKHGVAFDYSIGNVRYYGDGYSFIKSAYEALGTEAKVNLTIQYKCTADAEFEDFYTGKLDFGSYIEYVGSNGCYVSINVESTDTVMTFNNRFDQKVNLDSTVSFDGVSLPTYSALGKQVNFSAKAIPVSNRYENAQEEVTQWVGGLQPITNNISHLNFTRGQFTIGFDTEIASEIGNTYANTEYTQIHDNTDTSGILNYFPLRYCNGFSSPLTTAADFWPLSSSPVLNYAKGSPSYGWLDGGTSVNLKVTGRFTALNSKVSRISWALALLPDKISSTCGSSISHPNGEAPCDYESENCNIGVHTIIDGGDIYKAPTVNSPPDSEKLQSGQYVDFDLDGAYLINLEAGMRVYLLISLFEEKNQTMINACNAGSYAYQWQFDAGNYLSMANTSYGGNNAASEVKSYLLHETLARITESITNNEMTIKSDYFGRIDSQPFANLAGGCGGLEVVTNGLFIRGIDKVRPETPPKLSLSMKDMFDGLNPIHNIGFGIEDNPVVAGKKVLRVEPAEYFYPNTIVFTASKVNEITKQCAPDRIYSKFIFGYDKWEAQQYTGLDEFLTKREYRTSLTSVNNTLSQVSSFVASGYTIEIVRRLGNTTTQDNSYDDNIFIVCVKLGATKTFTGLTWEYRPVGARWRITGTGIGAFAQGSVFGEQMSISDGTTTTVATTWFYGGPDEVTIPNAYLTGISHTAPLTLTINRYIPEQGNVLNATNIIDPTTIYNYRISPIRNAMRWAKSIFQSYRNLPESLIYTDGDGNTFASGQLNSAAGCKLEAGVIAENATITPASFADPSDAAPIFNPETVSFTYPITHADFINIMTNRMGLIGYEINGVTKYGWISNFQFTFETGLATFQLIHKYE